MYDRQKLKVRLFSTSIGGRRGREDGRERSEGGTAYAHSNPSKILGTSHLLSVLKIKYRRSTRYFCSFSSSGDAAAAAAAAVGAAAAAAEREEEEEGEGGREEGRTLLIAIPDAAI